MPRHQIKTVRLRPSCLDSWSRFQREDDPGVIALEVLSDPHGEDTVLEQGLPIGWHQRVGHCRGERFRVVYTPCADASGRFAYVSYVAPV